jgi:ABC-2 type transport system ATP-binding protein
MMAGHDVVRDRRGAAPGGVVFQTQSLDKALTVEENLRAQGHLHGLSGALLRERMEACHGAAGPGGSPQGPGGDALRRIARRVEIAKALLHRPQVLLMDEASTGLDPAARRDFRATSNGCARRRRDHSADHPRPGRGRPLRPAGAAAPGRIVARAARKRMRSRIGGDVVVLEAEDAKALAAAVEQRFGLRSSLRGRRRCASKSKTGTASSPKWWRRFPARSNSVGLHKPTLGRCLRARNGGAIE